MSALWGPLIAAAVSLVGGYYTYRASTKASRLTAVVESQKVDAAAYERAKALYESGIAQLEHQLVRMRDQLNVERDVSNVLRNRMNELEETVARLRRQLIIAGIDIGQVAARPEDN